MYHSITFGDKNTWTDWHLIPTSRPLFAPPPLRGVTVDLPGVDGLIDISLMLNPTPMFANRIGSNEFVVMQGFSSWNILLSEIANHLHGKSMRAVLEDDPLYFYSGSFALSEWRSNKSFSTIVIDYTVDPYKKLIANEASASL